MPLCCVVEFSIRDWIDRLLGRDSSFSVNGYRPDGRETNGRRVRRIGGPRLNDPGYIPCTACVLAIRFGIQRPVRIHLCSPGSRECALYCVEEE